MFLRNDLKIDSIFHDSIVERWNSDRSLILSQIYRYIDWMINSNRETILLDLCVRFREIYVSRAVSFHRR